MSVEPPSDDLFAAAIPPERIYRVAELTRRVNLALEDDIGRVWVEGEISNLRQPGSGHLYFTLKDEQAQMAAVLFRGSQRGLAARPENGQRVQAFGPLAVYAPQGTYQLVVERLRPAGRGALQEQFEALKRKLAAEGLFDAGRKRPLPLLPRCVGIVTSPTGAAIRDILTVLDRRFPNLRILLAPARVQGAGAAEEIADGLRRLTEDGRAEALIVGRGGGSLEDLWAFNEEVVARAIAASPIPVISAVGHETDFTISDFVADLRAPTPSAAAELVIGRKADFLARIERSRALLGRLLRHRAADVRARLASAARWYGFHRPALLLQPGRTRVEDAQSRLAEAGRRWLRVCSQRVDQAHGELSRGLPRRLSDARTRLERGALQLRALGPLAVLSRGYSLTLDAAGRPVLDAASLRPGQPVRTRLARGSFESQVTSVQPAESKGEPEHEP